MRVLRVVVIVAGLAGLVAVVPVVHSSPDATYGGADVRLLVLEVAAALALLGLSAAGPARASSLLVGMAGAMWIVAELAGGVDVPLTARTGADALPPLLVATLLVAALLRDAAPGSVAVWTLAGAGVAAGARLLFVDPFDRLDCWRACEHNPLLLGDGLPVLETLGRAGVVVGVGWAAVMWWRRRRSPSGADLARWAVVAAAGVWLVVPPSGITSATDDVAAVTAFVVTQVAVLTWLALEVRDVVLRWRLEARLARQVSLIPAGRDPEELVHSIRAAVREPLLRLAFWAPERNAFVDSRGRLTDPAPGPNERTTTFTREGKVVAAFTHPARLDSQRLERALGPALLLALENGQLRAAALAELGELERSRARVVERAALERRRLERNLHDDAQQRAMSLSLLVRMLEGRSPVAPVVVHRAALLTRALTEELRRVARGIYPAVLADTGLAGAVLDLAERSTDVPVLVGDLPDVRCPGMVETTAYLVVSTGVEDARRGGASEVRVHGARVADGLRVLVEDDATAPASGAEELTDQVGALGGTLVIDGIPGRRRIEVVLPCES